jgi:hypothetical protein
MMRGQKMLLHDKVIWEYHAHAEFEQEVQSLIRLNHNLVLKGISELEKSEIDRLCEEAGPAELGGEIECAKSDANDLRRAANSLALVGLITRLQHWIGKLVEEITKENAKDNSLEDNLERLDKELKNLGLAPVPIQFFRDLATVRNSIVHADSQITWFRGSGEKRKQKQVPCTYVDPVLVELTITEAHLEEAIEKSIQQLRWYDERIDELKASKQEVAGSSPALPTTLQG